MSDVEKQESQKTVVAFITGLLIGGLLVWVFSSTPETAKAPEQEEVTKEITKSETKSETVADTKGATQITNGSVIVSDQKAGTSVTLGAAKYPTNAGWVVVRDYMDGVPGNILGAARYNLEAGLVPTSIELMRATTVGSSYQVVFFTNEGDAGFSTTEDKLIEGVATTFKTN